jgi:regulatory protein
MQPERDDDRAVLAAAYAILARRPHSREQVRAKLARKAFAEELIDNCLKHLDERGFLDDEEVARRWAQVMLRERCWGRLKAEHALQQRGIGRDLARQAVDEAQREFPQIDGARQALAGRFAEGADVPLGRAVNFLRSRGFSAGVVYEAVKEWERKSKGDGACEQ